MEPVGEIVYTRMSLQQHAPQTVASLIQASAPELFEVMFGRKAMPLLTDLIQRSQNRFSHRYIQVATIQDQVVGMAVLLPAAALNDRTDEHQILNRWQRLWLSLLNRLILDRVLQHDYPAGSFYLANLAVQPDYRSQGIGKQLLLQCIAAVPPDSPLFISVDIANPRAQKLYESIGFQVVTNKILRIPGRMIGSRVLIYRGSRSANIALGDSAQT